MPALCPVNSGRIFFVIIRFKEADIMFYVKKALDDEMTIAIDVTDENVFCKCPCCGDEIQVDLGKLMKEPMAELIDTSVMCDNCSLAWRKENGYD